MRSLKLLLPLLLTVSLASPGPAQDPPSDAPPPLDARAVSLLPPGNSGFVSTQGQVEGSAGGSYGENLDDQSQPYWGLEGYAGEGFADPAEAVRTETLLDGAVRIYWDAFGVPAIYGESGRDVWYGAGYAIAQIRLFLMDAVRRLGRGTYAELVGAPGVSDDVMQRTLTYTDEEYQAFFDGLSQDGKDAFEGYVEGANAWIAEVNADPSLLPAEYGLLNATPEPLDVIDSMAAGVLITRTVASEGGNEMDNVRLLRGLEEQLGVEEGRGVFRDLVWQDDERAATSVPAEEGRFPNVDLPDPDGAFEAAAEFAATLPLELTDGPGTGAYPDPQSAGFAADAGSGEAAEVPVGVPSATEALTEFAASLSGGSIAVAMGPSRTAEDGALLLSGPQLGYSYPSLLVELEVHGGGYHARGASVPALPTVGIGYTDRVAWALTTGYSKTIDSFVETIRGSGEKVEYRHDDEWKPADCRTESIPYRETAGGSLPVGPAARTEDVVVCRTVHGPIVAAEEGDGERLARSVTLQMFGREADTVEGVLAWNRARSLEEFEAAMRMVTWNENTTYADADGHIAYWHPGIHRERAPFDLRFPLPGDGSADFGEILPFEALPQVVDPEQGFLANWNNKPALGWRDGEGIGNTSRPGGAVQRVSNAIELVESRDDHTFATMRHLEVEAGLRDPRVGAFLPIILAALESEDEPSLVAVADLLSSWNRRFYDPPESGTVFTESAGTSTDGTDGPAATVFEAVLEALLAEVFADEWDGRPADAEVAATCNAGVGCPDLFNRQLGVGGHRYDTSPGHNLLLRVLDPSSSSLAPSRDYLDGRGVEEVVRGAVADALAALEAEYESTDLADYRRATHQSTVNSLTGVVGPSATQPYMDRGSYIHVVGFDGLGPLPATRVAGAERVATSIAASQAGFVDGAETVVLASAGGFTDALAATPLAGAEEAPLLLIDGVLRDDLVAEIQRLDSTTAVVVGAFEAVPEQVGRDLAELGLTVERIDGSAPADVAAAVARRIGAPGGVAYLVSSAAFPDAVSVAGVAGRRGAPVLYASADGLPKVTADALEELGVEATVVVGGTAVLPDDVVASLPDPTRVAGPERYATAERVLRHARELGLDPTTAIIATGEDFPDSLSGGALAAATDGLVVLTRGLEAGLPGDAYAWATSQRARIESVVGLGGTAVVADEVVAGLG